MRIKHIIPMLFDSVNPFFIFNESEDIYTRTLLKINFSEYDIMYTEDSTVTECYNTFRQYFILWKQNNSDRIERIQNTLNAEYNPIENMSVTEVNKSVTAMGKVKTTSKNLSFDVTNSSVTYDNGLKDNEKQSTTYKANPENETEYINDKSMNIDNTDYNGSSTNINSSTRHGNVGIQSNQGYINEEINLRRKNYIYELLKDFINEYCIYVGGCEY